MPKALRELRRRRPAMQTLQDTGFLAAVHATGTDKHVRNFRYS
jgi:hypothetical protein